MQARAYFEKSLLSPIAKPLSSPVRVDRRRSPGPTTIKVYELLRQKPGLDHVEEAKKDETQQLQITQLGSPSYDMQRTWPKRQSACHSSHVAGFR